MTYSENLKEGFEFAPLRQKLWLNGTLKFVNGTTKYLVTYLMKNVLPRFFFVKKKW